MLDSIARVLAIEEIKQLKARYFRYVDTKNWNALRAIFCRHAMIDFADAEGGAMTVDQTIPFIEEAFSDAVSLHHGHMPEIDILAKDKARAIWAMEDKVVWPENSKNPYGLYKMQGAGHYFETYEKHGDEWLIASLKLTRLRRTVELLPTGPS